MSYQTYNHNRNYGCRIIESTLAGYRAVTLENEKLRVTVLADKGSDIYEFLYKPRDIDFMWRSRLGLRPRDRFLPTSSRAQGFHMDYYEGGWQELFPNCGNLSVHQGAEIGQHGEVLLLPWNYTITSNEVDQVEVRFEVRTVRTPFQLIKTMSLRGSEPVLRIGETVINESGQTIDFTWGHHPAFGWPFIDETCKVDLPSCRIRTFEQFTPATSRLKAEQNSEWPFAISKDGSSIDISRIPGPNAAAHDMVFLEDLADGWYAVTNTSKQVGFCMRYPAHLFKQLWYWQVYRGGKDYPWWSSTYNIALEPCASLPILADAVKRGEALSLEAGESMEVELLAAAYEGLSSVDEVSDDGIPVGES